jgi:hypothetical protein
MIFRNRQYLSWVRRQECIATGLDFTRTDMVAHHVRIGGAGGMGIKPSDYRVIPLTAFQHAKLHQMVEREYYELMEVDIEEVMCELLMRFLRKSGLPQDHLGYGVDELICA